MQNTFRNIALSILILASVHAIAQTYNVGDIYVFPDGSKGIVCYVDPDNAKKGWAMALTDLEGTYAMNTTSSTIPGLLTDTWGTGWSSSSFTYNGKKNTKTLLESGVSPAAEAVDFYNGWYIPNISQIMQMYNLSGVLKEPIEAAGGNINIPT